MSYNILSQSCVKYHKNREKNKKETFVTLKLSGK